MDKEAFGLFEGMPIVGRKSLFEQYGIEHKPGEVYGHVKRLPIDVNSRGKLHTFYAMNVEDINLLAEKLSRYKRSEVKIKHNNHILKMWHRGQVVMGYRPPSFFNGGHGADQDSAYMF